MMALVAQSNQQFDLRLRLLLNIGLTLITAVGEYPCSAAQRPCAAQLLRQRLDLRDHRYELPLVGKRPVLAV